MWKIIGICVLACILGATSSLGFVYFTKDKSCRSPEFAPDQPPGTIVKLIAVLPEGTRVYRIEGIDLFVPATVAVSPSGQVAFR